MALQEGQNLGPYRIITQLGQGGMATVFKAYHPRLDRFVAVKVMHQAFLEDPAFMARFEREAQIVARLEHAHIVPVYDFSDFSGQPYLVMKYVEGQTLKALLNKGALPLGEIVRIMTAIAAALDYAHQQGVLHRDIKPSNIILDVNGVPYLTDFGLARIAQAGESTMSQDMLLGTPHYISPEQAMGRTDLDARTDLYSLGVILYELIVGRVPFSADTPYAIIHDHIYRPLPLPGQVNPDIPPGVENVLLKALAKEPPDRYETATQMIDALRQAAQDAHFVELKVDRATTAALSIARVREEQNVSGIGTPPTGIPAPITAPPISDSMTQPAAARGSKWVLGGFAALLVICIASVGVSLSAVDVFAEMAMIEEAARQQAAITLLEIPLEGVEAAQEAVRTHESDPVAQLTLARALWNEDHAADARTALMRGYELADDKVAYLLSAGNAASDDGYIPAAVLLAERALQESNQTPATYATVRAAVGERLYQLASEPGNLNTLEIRRVLAAESLEVSPLVDTMMARALITEERPELAYTILGRVLAQASTMAEAHLVLGDYYAETGERNRARSEWSVALEADDAPDWVRERAAEQLGFAF